MAEETKGKKEKICGRHEYFDKGRKKCELKPYSNWPIVRTENGVFRDIPSDLKDMIGAERFKLEYEDVDWTDKATGKKIPIFTLLCAQFAPELLV